MFCLYLSLCRCFFVQLFEEIQFLSSDFLFLALFKSSHERCRLFVYILAFLPIFGFLGIVVLLFLVFFVLFLVVT